VDGVLRETRQVQSHHLSYEPEVTILIFKGEHFILTLLNRMKKYPSEAFLRQLDKWTWKHLMNSHHIQHEEMARIRREQDAKRQLKRRKKGRQLRLRRIKKSDNLNLTTTFEAPISSDLGSMDKAIVDLGKRKRAKK
jgi:hypothetical protein